MVFNIATISSCYCVFMDYLRITPIFLCQLFSDASKLLSTHFRNAPFYTLMKGNCDKARKNIDFKIVL